MATMASAPSPAKSHERPTAPTIPREIRPQLLTISHELHEEIEELLYTQFGFSFPCLLDLASASGLIDPLSTLAKRLLREVVLPIHLKLLRRGTEEILPNFNTDMIRHQREVFEYMRDTLPGVRKVLIYFIFVGGPLHGSMPQERVDESAHLIMGLVFIFAPTSDVVLRDTDLQQCAIDVVEACRKRLLEFTSGSQSRLISKMEQTSLRE
jgi:hypothetical protein